ncbi:hypothetical protein O6H91_16G038200 [Diphasiastrum complanatum]|uniref:Uncharacterized protein n=2 Tax=Diphasiastrum complanatum TaxID=34168 RepID=A0ACC2BBH7_DIPCM|nr:hypothetical protein O6H91_16G038200 [Diphasiastrum complanatum]KAJ7527126.1 hypothetical protein O6H91_16G038200 [Diphasiastrum complanatum]
MRADGAILTNRPSSSHVNKDSPAEYASFQTSNGLFLSTGNHILLLPATPQADLYIARIEDICQDSFGKTFLQVRWFEFYRAKDLRHQPPSCPKSDEVYLTNYIDCQPSDSVVAKCKIVTTTHFRALKATRWSEMADALERLYLCEYRYSAETGTFTPIQDSELHVGELNDREHGATSLGTDALAMEFAEILINIEKAVSEGAKSCSWRSSRSAWIIKTKEARNVRDVVQALLDLEEGLQTFSAKRSSPSIDYITWRKTMSEVNTYELLSKYVKQFKQQIVSKTSSGFDYRTHHSFQMQGFDAAMQKKRKRCPMDLTLPKRPVRLSEGESIASLALSAANILPATAESTINKQTYQLTGCIRSGVVYEMDHRSLPPKVPIQMKSLRVVMVSEITKLHVTVKFPSTLSLRMYFKQCREGAVNEVIATSCFELQQETIMGTKPDMDEHFVMSPKTAERVLMRPVSCTEYLHQGHLKSFWFIKDILTEDNADQKNELYGIAQSMSIQVSEAPCQQTAVSEKNDVEISRTDEKLLRDEESAKSFPTTVDIMNTEDKTRYLLDSVGRDLSNSQSEIVGSCRNVNKIQKNPQALKFTDFFKDDNEGNNILETEINKGKNSVWEDVSSLGNLECAENRDVNFDELGAGIKAAAETLTQLIPETMNTRSERGIGATVNAIQVQEDEGPFQWGIRRKVSTFGRCRGQSAGSCDIGIKEYDKENGKRDKIGKENLQGRSRSKLMSLTKTTGLQKAFSLPNPSNSSTVNGGRERSDMRSQPNILKLPKDMQGRWSSERYKSAQLKLLDIMHQRGAAPGNPILRPALREEARKHIGDTGLLDHLLKHMTDTVVCNGERFRRRHNADGAMEYWLEDASLMEIRRMAGIEDPSWIPPPGWKPGDKLPERGGCIFTKGMSPSEAAEMKQLKEDVVKLKSEMQSITRQLQGSQTDMRATLEAVTDGRNLGYQNCSDKWLEDDMKGQFQIIKLKMLEIQSTLGHVQEQQQHHGKILRTFQMQNPETFSESSTRDDLQRKGGDENFVHSKGLDSILKRLDNLDMEVQKLSQENLTRYENYVTEKRTLESHLSTSWNIIAKMKEEFCTALETLGMKKLQTQQSVATPLKVSSLPILCTQSNGDFHTAPAHLWEKSSLGQPQNFGFECLKAAPHSLRSTEMMLLQNQLRNIQSPNLHHTGQASASQNCETLPQSPQASMRMPICQEQCHRKPRVQQLPNGFLWPSVGSGLHSIEDGFSPSSSISASATVCHQKGAETTRTMALPSEVSYATSYDNRAHKTNLLENSNGGHTGLTQNEQKLIRSPPSAIASLSSSSTYFPEITQPGTFLVSGNLSVDSIRYAFRDTTHVHTEAPSGQMPRTSSQGQALVEASLMHDRGPVQLQDAVCKENQSARTSANEQHDNEKTGTVTKLCLGSDQTSCSYALLQTSKMMTAVLTDQLNSSSKKQCPIAPSGSLQTQSLVASTPSSRQTHGVVQENLKQVVVSSMDIRTDPLGPAHKLAESSLHSDGLNYFLSQKSGETANAVSMSSW